MAEVIRYVDPDSAAGGDGTTWALAYDSLFDWEAAEQTNLVTDGDWHHVYLRASSGTADTTACLVTGWTTDATHYILIEAADGDQAVKDGWDTARYRLVVDTYDYNSHCLLIDQDYVTVDGLQLKYGTRRSGVDVYGALMFSSNTNGYHNTAKNCLVVYGDNGDGNNSGISCSIYRSNCWVWNCVTIGFAAGYNNFIRDGNDVYYMHVYNSIAYGGTNGFVNSSNGDASYYNCASFNNTDDFTLGGTGDTVIDYCASDDGDGTNSVAPSGADWDNEYTAPATGNFTLLNGGNCYQGGADNPSSGLYTTDMEGDTYNDGAYSIGVDEYVSAGGAVVPTADLQGPLWGPLGGPIMVWR